MPRAKSINRLELTRSKFGAKMYGDKLEREVEQARENFMSTVLREQQQHREGYSTCPNCGQETLIHEDGCMHCKSCGWSACG